MTTSLAWREAIAGAAPEMGPDDLATVAARFAAAGRLWRPFVRHDPARRSYLRLVWTLEHEVWLLCWPPGQLVDLHDHGRSAGAFVVTDGMLREDHLDGGAWRKAPCRRGVVRTFPSGHVHTVWNPGPGTATSIHAYAPPLRSMTFYTRDVHSGLQPTHVELVPKVTPCIDPTRTAQGVMTGIGFLGAGVIMREGLSVRGLTTAASIWVTAAIGILAGVGFYSAAAMGTVLTLGTLSVFRWIEGWMPTLLYAHHHVVFARTATMAEATLRTVLVEHGFSVANLSYRLNGDGRLFEYRMVIRTRRPANLERLTTTWLGEPTVVEFRIAPTGD